MNEQLRFDLKKPYSLSIREAPVTDSEWAQVLAAMPEEFQEFLQQGKNRGYFEGSGPQHYRLVEGANQYLIHQTSLLFRIRTVRSRHRLVAVIKKPRKK